MGDQLFGWIVGTVISWVLLGIVAMMLLWQPITRPWTQEREGMAKLNRAKQERQILVEQARAEEEAAELRARAIAIVGQAAQDFPEYRQQEFIAAFAESLQTCNPTTIYIPTEANVPVTEAMRAPQ